MKEKLLKLRKYFPERLTNTQIFIVHLLLAIVIFHPYITNEFWADDYFFVSILKSKEIKYPIAGFWSVDIKDYDTFQNLWWKDETVKAKFFRPIPSIIFSLIFWLSSNYAAIILHCLSILLHSLVAFSVFLVLFKFSKVYSASFLASIIFLISEDHSMTVGWISTNPDLFAVLFINLGLYYHVKQRETDKSLHKKLSKLYMTLALCSKETAIIGPVAIMLYEFILLESGSKERNIFKRFLNKLLLFVKNQKQWRFHFFLIFGFLIFYKIFGFGTNNLMYLDPFKRPAGYLKNVITGLPTMLIGLLSNFPFGLVIFNKQYLYIFTITGIILYFIFSISLVPYWKNRMIHYSFLLFTISLLPQLITIPSERLIYFPFVFGSYLIAYLILNVQPLKMIFFKDNPRGLKYIGNIFGYYLILSALLMSLYLSLYYPEEYKKEFRKITEIVEQANSYLTPETKEIYYLTTPSIFYTFYLNDITRIQKEDHVNAFPLSSFSGDIKIKLLDSKSFVLETETKGWVDNLFAKVVRVYPKIETGKKHKLRSFIATVLKTSLDGNDIFSVKFDFYESLFEKDKLFVYHNGNKIIKLSLDTLNFNHWYQLREKLKTLY